MSAPPGPVRRGAPAPSSRSHRRATGRLLAAGLLTAVAAVGVLPDLLFRTDRYSPFVQLVAFRPYLLGGEMLFTAVAVLVTLRRVLAWPFAAGLALVALVGAGLVVPRTITDPLLPGGRSLSVLSFNTYRGEADVGALAELIHSQRPDLVSLPEAGAPYRDRLAPLVKPLGYRLYTSTPPGSPDVSGVTALVAAGLGDVDVRVGDTRFRYLEVTGGGLGALHFVAFHAVAPTPGAVPQWRADLSGLARWCAGPAPAVIAGDFNATLDHSVLRSAIAGCGDAAAQRGKGLAATWPTWAPPWLGTQIDHVLGTDGIAAETFAVHDIPGSDHRAIRTTLRVPG